MTDERLTPVLAALAGLLAAAEQVADSELVNPDPDARVAVRNLNEAIETAEQVLHSHGK